MKAAYAALGGDPDELDLLLMQFAHLVRAGQKASLSKRAGQIVSLDDLVDEIGVDAARWFLLARSHDTTIDIDLDLAVQQNAENPVYYVQYAHARVPKIFAKAGPAAEADPTAAGPLEPIERELIAKLLGFPAEVREAAARRAPHRIGNYALDVARTFHVFYERCRVVGSEQEAFRLAECEATRRVVARSLDLLGVKAPETM
jgi:arginyl-tRNA synthetase